MDALLVNVQNWGGYGDGDNYVPNGEEGVQGWHQFGKEEEEGKREEEGGRWKKGKRAFQGEAIGKKEGAIGPWKDEPEKKEKK
jgi:hypothetical protein